MPNRIALATLALSLASIAVPAMISCSSPAQQAMPASGPAWCGPEALGNMPAGEVRVSFRREVVPMLQAHCAACHGPGGAGSDALMLFDAAGTPQYALIRNRIGQILLELQTGRMPQGRPYSLPQAQFRQLDVWAASGAPDN